MGLTMQISDFGALTADLFQPEQKQQEDSANLTSLVQPNISAEPAAVQTNIWTAGQTRHSVLTQDQSVQSNVVMIILLATSIVIYSLVRRPSS